MEKPRGSLVNCPSGVPSGCALGNCIGGVSKTRVLSTRVGKGLRRIQSLQFKVTTREEPSDTIFSGWHFKRMKKWKFQDRRQQTNKSQTLQTFLVPAQRTQKMPSFTKLINIPSHVVALMANSSTWTVWGRICSVQSCEKSYIASSILKTVV